MKIKFKLIVKLITKLITKYSLYQNNFAVKFLGFSWFCRYLSWKCMKRPIMEPRKLCSKTAVKIAETFVNVSNRLHK